MGVNWLAQNKITKDWVAADLVVESGHAVRGVRPIAICDAVWTLNTSHLIFPGGIWALRTSLSLSLGV
jgi:hypothetical protein